MGRNSHWAFLLALALLPTLVAGCGGGGSSGKDSPGGTLVLIDVSVGEYDGVPLNEIIEFEFSEPLDPDTVRPDTIQIRQGPNFGRQVPGFYKTDGRFVQFFPRLPLLPDLSDGGLQPATEYRITLPGQPKVAVVRSATNDRLKKKTVASFRTAAAGDPNLFRDNFIDPLPPRVLFVNPPDGAEDVPADAEITITFNRRPLHPATVSPTNITLTMVERMGVPVSRPISGTPTLVQSYDSVVVVFVPTFPLADDATYELHVDRRVADLVGNDIDPSFDSVFSIRDEPARFDHIDWNYTELEKQTIADMDNTTASWNESVEDALAALFTVAGGNGTAGDLHPVANQQFDPRDFSRGHERLTEGGVVYDVYNFRSINIPSGVTVRFAPESKSDNYPAKLLSLKPIVLNGILTVSGGKGDNGGGSGYDTKYTKAYGGAAGPGGGYGADIYMGSKMSSAPATDGEDVDPGGGGGKGGEVASSSTAYGFGGGAGGGGSRTAGTDGTDGGYTRNSWKGSGGKGGKSTEERGYPANYERVPNTGGAGGGSGGRGFYNYYGWVFGPGAGGGGGGAITIQGASSVDIGASGKILADGGDGGRNTGSPYYNGGAGAGGAGGSVLIRATGTMTFGAGATISVKGGLGALWTNTYTYYKGGEGGDGGDGYIRLEAREDENAPGKPLISGDAGAIMTYPEYSKGVFAPQGGGAPSVAQTLWENLGVFDPIMLAPKVDDIVATLYNDEMTIEVQLAIEDQNNLGNPNLNNMDVLDKDGDGEYDDTLDPTRLSEWTNLYDIEDLNGNGFQYIRTRITFQLDDSQTADHPLPYMEYLRIRFKF
jgi:hypothetical protein